VQRLDVLSAGLSSRPKETKRWSQEAGQEKEKKNSATPLIPLSLWIEDNKGGNINRYLSSLIPTGKKGERRRRKKKEERSHYLMKQVFVQGGKGLKTTFKRRRVPSIQRPQGREGKKRKALRYFAKNTCCGGKRKKPRDLQNTSFSLF